MSNIKTLYFMKTTRKFIYSAIVFASLMLGACSSDDSGSSSGNETVRLTMSVSSNYDIGNSHYISLVFTASYMRDASLRVNGELIPNQDILEFTADDEAFNTTRTYVIEATGEEFLTANIAILGHNNSDLPFTLSLKLEKGSKVFLDKTQDVIINGDWVGETHMLSFDDSIISF